MIKITKGETLLLSCKFKKNRKAEILDNWTVRAGVLRVVGASDALQECNVAVTSGTGDFTIEIDSSTLPVGQLVLSIRFENGATGPRSTVNEQLLISEDQDWS
jgi:hypothetical protein